MPDPAETAPDEDGTKDLNLPTVNEDYGLDKEPDTDHFIDQQPKEPDQPTPEDPIDQLQPEPKHIEPLSHTPPEVNPEVPDQGAIGPRRSHRTRHKPQRLVPQFG